MGRSFIALVFFAAGWIGNFSCLAADQRAKAPAPDVYKDPELFKEQTIVRALTESAKSWYQTNKKNVGGLFWILEDGNGRMFLTKYILKSSDGEESWAVAGGLVGEGAACLTVEDGPGVNLEKCAKTILARLQNSITITCSDMKTALSGIEECRKAPSREAICCFDAYKVGPVPDLEAEALECKKAGSRCGAKPYSQKCISRLPKENGILTFRKGGCAFARFADIGDSAKMSQ